MARVSWRLCMRRPEVGFDMHWGWGPWSDLVRDWSFARSREGADRLYIQRWSDNASADFELDIPFLEEELAKRLMR